MLSPARERHGTPAPDDGIRRQEFALAEGGFDVAALLDDHRRCFGLLVTDGLIVAEVKAGRAQMGWLLGAGDLVRPWEMAGISLTQTSEWRALTDARMLRIERVSELAGQLRPDTADKLLSASACTTHWLLAQSLIISSPSISERLLLLFALYGERWGKVTPNGVRIELPITHELLGKLCGARRPTVTVAIKSLTEEGFLTRASNGSWLLHPPPYVGAAYACWKEYANALGFDQAVEPSRSLVETPPLESCLR